MNNFSFLNYKIFTTSSCFFLIALLFTSCASKKDVLYLQDVDFGKKQIENNYTTVFQPDDILVINVSSPDVKGAMPFNMPNVSANSTTGVVNGLQQQINYLIRKDGSIEFPVLGKVQLAGLTMIEAVEYLRNEIKAYIKEPIVNIQWVNFKFTVLGDVLKPGTYIVKNERTTILEALGMAGDLTITGVRKEILLIREINNERITYRFDLTSKDIFESDVYYIKQNDVIIVQPNKAQVNASVYNRNVPLYISVASVLISLIAVLSRI